MSNKKKDISTMKNRVKYNESIPDSIKRIPFLMTICEFKEIRGENMVIAISSEKINDYSGKVVCSSNDGISSELINELLELAEKKGDLL